jgi:hypothetical protein
MRLPAQPYLLILLTYLKRRLELCLASAFAYLRYARRYARPSSQLFTLHHSSKACHRPNLAETNHRAMFTQPAPAFRAQ